MKIIYFGKGPRGAVCLEKILEAGYTVPLVVGHDNTGEDRCPVLSLARTTGIPTVAPVNPNDRETESLLKQHNADVFILGGYGKIIKKNIIGSPRIMCLNLHGGKLPDYRGSSPLNWVLINGETSFTLSVIKVDAGVDTGDILCERTFPIGPDDTIAHLHTVANEAFPKMLLSVLSQIESGNVTARKQQRREGAYFPRRFPGDGLILFDQLTAQQVHNRIRALTEPYPCAFSYFNGKKVLLTASELPVVPHYGEPGRIYKKNTRGLLVGCQDRCIGIKTARFADDDRDFVSAAEVRRYDELATLRNFIINFYEGGGK